MFTNDRFACERRQPFFSTQWIGRHQSPTRQQLLTRTHLPTVSLPGALISDAYDMYCRFLELGATLRADLRTRALEGRAKNGVRESHPAPSRHAHSRTRARPNQSCACLPFVCVRLLDCGALCRADRNSFMRSYLRTHTSSHPLLTRIIYPPTHVLTTLKGLTFILMRRPGLLLGDKTGPLLTTALRDASGQIRAKALTCLSDILLAEESRLISGAASAGTDKRSSTAEQVAGDQDADSCVIGGVVQQYLEQICEVLLDPEPQVRFQAISLTSVLLRQGMIYPPQIVTPLIALQSDSDDEVRGAAMSELVLIAEKHADSMVSCAADGLRAAHAFQLDLHGDGDAVTATRLEASVASLHTPDGDVGGVGSGSGDSGSDDEGPEPGDTSVFSSYYRQCLGSGGKGRKSWKRFVLELVNLFKEDKRSGARPGLPFLCYVAETLASLPYQTQEEPLFIIFHSNRLLALVGSTLEGELEAGLKAWQSGGEGASLEDLRDQTEASVGLAMLLQAKHYLKAKFQLDDERCASYDPATSLSKVCAGGSEAE